MCGIVGYIGTREAARILIEGLKRLEYRGYDSAGISTIGEGAYSSAPQLHTRKQAGKVEELKKRIAGATLGTLGIGHTRWATHGEPSERNAHPHESAGLIRPRKPSICVAVVHNGIIENYESLKLQLQQDEFEFKSDTDTEVLPHLIEQEYNRGSKTLEQAVTDALRFVEGAYAIAVISNSFPNQLVAACNSSPLVIGIGKDELFVASDEAAFAGSVDAVVHLKDGELVVLERNGMYRFRGLSLESSRIEAPTVSLEAIQKNGHAYFMHKEIFEQPQALRNVLSHKKNGEVRFGGLTSDIEARLKDARRIILVGCGTSLYAAMAGKLLLQKFGGVICEAEQAAEWSYQEPDINSQDVVIGISQSGETADTLRAIAYAKEHHALCLSITNRVCSTLAKRTRLGMYLHAGSEIAVASTKAFTSQIVMLALLSLKLAWLTGKDPTNLPADLFSLPGCVHDALEREKQMQKLAWQHKDAKRIIFIGRGSTLPLAYEAALKVREVAYIDAHGLSAAELKHGTLALVEKGTPVVALMPGRRLRAKMLSNLKEVESRGGNVILFDDPSPKSPNGLELAEELLPVALAPLVQLFAYHLGVVRGNDVDQPRNLAKAVTVE